MDCVASDFRPGDHVFSLVSRRDAVVVLTEGEFSVLVRYSAEDSIADCVWCWASQLRFISSVPEPPRTIDPSALAEIEKEEKEVSV